jgi:hypothetical protein
MILRDTAQTLIETVTKSNRLLKYPTINRCGRFIYGDNHIYLSRENDLQAKRKLGEAIIFSFTWRTVLWDGIQLLSERTCSLVATRASVVS